MNAKIKPQFSYRVIFFENNGMSSDQCHITFQESTPSTDLRAIISLHLREEMDFHRFHQLKPFPSKINSGLWHEMLIFHRVSHSLRSHVLERDKTVEEIRNSGIRSRTPKALSIVPSYFRNLCSLIHSRFRFCRLANSWLSWQSNIQISWKYRDSRICLSFMLRYVVMFLFSYSNPACLHAARIVVLAIAASYARKSLKMWSACMGNVSSRIS
jgi:hypothetical protein